MVRFLRTLSSGQFCEQALFLHQLAVGPVLDDLAALYDQDAVGVLDRGETMGYHDPGGAHGFQRLCDDGLGLVVEGTGGFVENDDAR